MCIHVNVCIFLYETTNVSPLGQSKLLTPEVGALLSSSVPTLQLFAQPSFTITELLSNSQTGHAILGLTSLGPPAQ